MIEVDLRFSPNPVHVLEGVRNAMKRRILKTAVRRASINVKQAMKGAAPKGPTGALKVSIGTRLYIRKNGMVSGNVIGAKLGYSKQKKGQKKGTLVQLYAKRVEKKHGFMKRTFRAEFPEFFRKVHAIVREELEKLLAKGG